MSTTPQKAPWLYRLFLVLVVPFALLRLWWRGRKQPGYRQHIGERFGLITLPDDDRPILWLHAVSVGETRAAEPLVDALLAQYPYGGQVEPWMEHKGLGHRRAVVGNYKVVYRIQKNEIQGSTLTLPQVIRHAHDG